MEKSVEVLFNDKVVNHYLEIFNLGKNHQKLGDFENYVFEVNKESEPFILRLTHSSHRNKDEISAEIDWMNYLHGQKISVPEAFPSVNGVLVEEMVLNDGSSFFGCLFSKADGYPVKVMSEQFNKELFYAWGKVIGQMHSATKNYKPFGEFVNRPSWDGEDLLNIEKYIPSDERSLVENTKILIEELEGLPKNKENFGLIHTDVHSGNFFFDGEKVHVFDFDDCCYHWFASDIAIPLYYSILYNFNMEKIEERNEFAEHFISEFMRGYETANDPPEHWKSQLPLFLRLRDTVLYSVLHKKIAPEDRSERLSKMMSEIKIRITNNEPIVKLK